LPSVFLYGGSIMPGKFHARSPVVDVSKAWQSLAGKMPRSPNCFELGKSGVSRCRRLRRTIHGQHHGCRPEPSGLALPYSSGPREILSRDDFALKSGER